MDSQSATPCRVKKGRGGCCTKTWWHPEPSHVSAQQCLQECRGRAHLLPIDNEVFDLRSTVTSHEARLDIKAGSFWPRGETAFFDVRVTHVNSTCNQNKSTESIFMEHEKEKKRKYQQRVIDVEMGSFTPTGFWHERRNGERMQTFPEQPSGQTFPKEQRVLCQCHILA